MRSKDFLIEYKIRQVKRTRPDDSIEVKFEVVDSKGVTRKIFNDRSAAQSWAKANWMDL